MGCCCCLSIPLLSIFYSNALTLGRGQKLVDRMGNKERERSERKKERDNKGKEEEGGKTERNNKD